jgi:lipoprotein-releasing system permease protein
MKRLSFPLALALRYFRSARKDAFVTFLSSVAAAGLALGVAALILSLAALSGFQSALKIEVMDRSPQIEIELAGVELAAWAPIEARLASLPGVARTQRVLRGRGWLVRGSHALPVEIVGFEGSSPRWFPGAPPQGGGVLVSEAMGARWGLAPGAQVTLVSPRPSLTPLGPQPRARGGEVSGFFASSRSEQEERVGASWDLVAGLFGLDAARLEVEAAGPDESLRLLPQVRSLLPPLAVVRTWKELNRPLFFALRLERTVMFVAVALIVLVATLALVADISLLIANKQAELGILLAMGATPASLQRTFLNLGLLIGGTGVAGGLGVGIASAAVLDRYRILRLPDEVYFLDHVPFLVRGGDLAAVLAVSVALVLVFTWAAARRAAHLLPVEALAR